MGNFSDFSKSDINEKKYDKADVNSYSASDSDKNYIDDMFSKYSSMNQNDLMQEFFKQYTYEKNKGNVDKNYFNDALKKLGPYLSKEQIANFENLINMVK